MSNESKSLEEHLDDNDWALIIGPDGNLKGMFIPDGSDEDEIPYSIVAIMEKFFGISFDEDNDNEESDSGPTFH